MISLAQAVGHCLTRPHDVVGRAFTLTVRTVLLLVAALLTAPGAQAQLGEGVAPVDPMTSMNLYLAEPDYDGCGTFDEGAHDDCDDLVVAPHPGLTFLWILISREDGYPQGVGGLGFGIAHSGIGTPGWQNCTGGTQFVSNDWPDSGSGIVIFWQDQCYFPPRENAKIGYFVIEDGASGMFAVIGNPLFNPQVVQWENCDFEIFDLCEGNLAAVELDSSFGPVCGDNCNGPTPVVETTWSRLKGQFR